MDILDSFSNVRPKNVYNNSKKDTSLDVRPIQGLPLRRKFQRLAKANPEEGDTHSQIRKSGLRHNGEREGRRLLNLSDYSDPKSVESKATTEPVDTISNNEMRYHGSQGAINFQVKEEEMDFEGDRAQSVGTLTFEKKASNQPTEQQHLAAQKTMEQLPDGTAFPTNDNLSNNYANKQNIKIEQHWQPAQRTKQQQLTVPVGMGELGGGSFVESTGATYANTPEIETQSIGPVNSKAFSPNQQTNYQNVEVQPSKEGFIGETASTSSNTSVTPNQEMQKQWQAGQKTEQQLSAAMGPMRGKLNGAEVESENYISSKSETTSNSMQVQPQSAQQIQHHQQSMVQPTADGLVDGASMKSTASSLSNKLSTSTAMGTQQQWQPTQLLQNQPLDVAFTEDSMDRTSMKSPTDGLSHAATVSTMEDKYKIQSGAQMQQQQQQQQKQQPAVQVNAGSSVETILKKRADSSYKEVQSQSNQAVTTERQQPLSQPLTGVLANDTAMALTTDDSMYAHPSMVEMQKQSYSAQEMKQQQSAKGSSNGGLVSESMVPSTKILLPKIESGQSMEIQPIDKSADALATKNVFSNYSSSITKEANQQMQPTQKKKEIDSGKNGPTIRGSEEFQKQFQPNEKMQENRLEYQPPMATEPAGIIPTAQQPIEHYSEEESMLPPLFDSIANFPSVLELDDIPVLWNIPKGGTAAVNDILAGCLQLSVANHVGAEFDNSNDKSLHLFEKYGAKFVNVDMFTIEGIARAKQLHLTSSGLVEAIVVNHIHEACELFSPTHRGAFFTVLRDPIERALVIIRDKIEDKTAATYNPAFANMTIEAFAKNGLLNANWMTRWLSNQLTGPLSEQHLNLAKEILRTKFVIGLYNRMQKSMEHFEKYFGWRVLNNDHREQCVGQHLANMVNKNDVSMEIPAENSKAYKALLAINYFDVELYRYGKVLFQRQVDYFNTKPRPEFGKRL